ncbi:MAG: hypothetical protein KC420_14375 [Myxococcales bacterium]|nr:hypothetical protein [Myxococcales bacterium]MCB9701750.1 hypothetical protein [Myxococcales bacterium]
MAPLRRVLPVLGLGLVLGLGGSTAHAEPGAVASESSSVSRNPRERSDWYLGLAQAFGILFSGRQQVAPGSITAVRIGGVVNPRALVGVQILAGFDIGKSTQSVLSGTLSGLFEFTLFPLVRGGFFVQGGLGAGAYWAQDRSALGQPPGVEPRLRSIAPGGAAMAAIGQELRIGRSLNLGIFARYDGMLIFEGTRLVNGAGIGVALLWY